MMDATFSAVLRLWEQRCSRKEIARRLGISEQKVKKILLTAGCIHTVESAMRRRGKTLPEIMELTGKSQSAVCANLPYDKGMYGAEYPTVNALRIRECRKKKKEDEKMKKISAEMVKKIHANGGRYDTRTYRYIVADTATSRAYKRLPISKLGTTAALTEWDELEAPEC